MRPRKEIGSRVDNPVAAAAAERVVVLRRNFAASKAFARKSDYTASFDPLINCRSTFLRNDKRREES